jgi:glycosyltransferase involved in cell wall biosynthesis
MKDKPLINILTRTSGRPNAFKRCVDTVKQQTYQNINHIIITDSKDNIEYINQEGYWPHLVDRDLLIKNDNTTDPHTGPYSPHNLYFNEVKHLVKEGWVIYLDDDDYLFTEDTLQEIVDKINENDSDTIIYWQMLYTKGLKLPTIIDSNNPPKIGGIGSPCFTYHTKYHNDIVWDGWKCADFRVINKLHQIIPKHIFLQKPLIFIPEAGFGNKKDI